MTLMPSVTVAIQPLSVLTINGVVELAVQGVVRVKEMMLCVPQVQCCTLPGPAKVCVITTQRMIKETFME